MPRRRYQTGCLQKVNGKWVLYWWQDEIRAGERVLVKCSKRLGPIDKMTKAEAQFAAQPILKEANNQTTIPVREMNGRLIAPTLKPSTLKGMESNLRAHILPILGGASITELDARRYQELLTSMMASHARGTRRNVIIDLQSILKSARQWHGGIPVVERKELAFGPKKPGEGRKAVLTIPQVKAILGELEKRPKWHMFFTMLALTAIRSNEILGLRREDLDFDNDLIHIRQGSWEGNIQTVKIEASENPIPMPPRLKKLLQAYLVNHPHQLVFANKKGEPLRRGRIVERVLHPILDKLGIPREGRRIGLHAFRHTLASVLLKTSGVIVAQRQLRHKRATTTVEGMCWVATMWTLWWTLRAKSWYFSW